MGGHACRAPCDDSGLTFLRLARNGPQVQGTGDGAALLAIPASELGAVLALLAGVVGKVSRHGVLGALTPG